VFVDVFRNNFMQIHWLAFSPAQNTFNNMKLIALQCALRFIKLCNIDNVTLAMVALEHACVRVYQIVDAIVSDELFTFRPSAHGVRGMSFQRSNGVSLLTLFGHGSISVVEIHTTQSTEMANLVGSFKLQDGSTITLSKRLSEVDVNNRWVLKSTIAFSSDVGQSKLISCVAQDNAVMTHSLATGKSTAATVNCDKRCLVYSADFSSDASIVAVGAIGVVIVWKTGDGSVVNQLRGHAGVVQQCRWSANGTELATCADDRTARLWRFTTLSDVKQCVTMYGHAGCVWTCAFGLPCASDETRLFTGSTDGVVRVWSIGTDNRLSSSIESSLSVTVGDIWCLETAVVSGCELICVGGADGSMRTLSRRPSTASVTNNSNMCITKVAGKFDVIDERILEWTALSRVHHIGSW
jgi:WD40 repeat protein